MRAVEIAVASLALAAGALVAPAAGTAADGWEAAVPLTRSGADVWDLELSLVEGSGMATWVHWTDDRTRLLVARQRRDGSWSRPGVLPGTGQVVEAEVAADARGRVRLAWTVGRRVLTARLRTDGSTSRPVVLHRTPGGPLGTRPAYLRLAVNATGATVVAWETMDDDEAPPYAEPVAQVVARDAGGPWSPALTLSSEGVPGIRPEVVVARSGRMTAAWGERDGRAWSVRAASRPAGEDWGTGERLSAEGERAGVPHLAGLPSGRVAVAYAFRSEEAQGIAVRHGSSGPRWSSPARIRGARIASWVDVGLGRTDAVVAYTDRRDAAWAASVSRSGLVTRTRLLPEVSVYYGMQVVANPSGEAVAVWDSVMGDDHPIEAAVRRRDGTWGRVARLSAGGVDGFLGAPVIAPDGGALVLWNAGDETDPDSSRVWVRSFAPRAR
ncbi:hypothetical protein [Nocardioides sp. S5]|uniref:hypothetical protein n=1 Tax=Nocardioides sp. S5 TaxID=2017486 RepID=UPI001A8FF98E|nr:hypothetical protein [Nocardioides sp. S5]